MSSNVLTHSRWTLLAKIAWSATVLLIAVVLFVVCFGGTTPSADLWVHGWPFCFQRRECLESSRFDFWNGHGEFRPIEFLLDVIVFVSIPTALFFAPHLLFGKRASQRCSLAVKLLFSSALAVVCFGGTRIHYSGGTFGWGETWEHGWPFVFLYRGGFMESTRFSFWENQGWDDPEGFRPWMLLVDALVFLSLLGLLIFASRWLNRRPAAASRIAFSLSSLFAVVTLACLLLGSIGYSLASSRTERAAMAKLKEQGHTLGVKYIGPRWLARLLGKTDPYEESVLHGCRLLQVHKWGNAEDLRKLAEAVQLLQYLEELDLATGSFQDEDLSVLLYSVRTTQIEKLNVNNTGVTGNVVFANPQAWPKLRAVDAGYSGLDDAGFKNLAKIPSVTWINVGSTKITKKSIMQAASMPNLNRFYAKDCGFTAADCAVLTARGVECSVAD